MTDRVAVTSVSRPTDEISMFPEVKGAANATLDIEKPQVSKATIEREKNAREVEEQCIGTPF